MATRFHAHDLSRDPSLYNKFVSEMYFDSHQDSRGQDIGGRRKLQLLQEGDTRQLPKLEQSLGLSQLIIDLFDLCRSHYAAMSSQIAEWQADAKEKLEPIKELAFVGWSSVRRPTKGKTGLDSRITVSADTESKNISEERSGELVLNIHEAMYEVLDRAQDKAMYVIIGEFY